MSHPGEFCQKLVAKPGEPNGRDQGSGSGRIPAARLAGGWQPMATAPAIDGARLLLRLILPDDETPYICEAECVEGVFDQGADGVREELPPQWIVRIATAGNTVTDYATHWMPLPEDPAP
ncbi:hypothetical protein [Falsiroseomonas ponticola]|uniref:hypothetical protein n=1 Tax=Falsiroseomonas ponticola TaxID=2786951 RepID=UPI0019332048|nr:hypothetical protein [Roseomonas ponticola]